MAKNKLIALGIITVITFTVFQWGFIDFSVQTEFMQALSMATVIIGSIVAIFMFNKDSSSSKS